MAAGFAFAFGNAYAFHSGGVAECEGCHSMHNSFEGVANVTGMPQFQSGPYLLKARDPSGACLNCHQSPDSAPTGYHISTDDTKLGPGIAPVEMTPGGDFAWLKKSYTFLERGSPVVEDGDRHGHNVVAVDFGFGVDRTLTAAPGPAAGTTAYPAARLACSSCHDPHGRYRRLADGSQVDGSAANSLPIFGSGSYPSAQGDAFPQGTQNGATFPKAGIAAAGVYRILGGVGYRPASLAGLASPFANPAPDAVAPSSYNRSESSAQTHVAYGRGMSEWCGNCHGQIIDASFQSGVSGHRHPAGNNTAAQLGLTIAGNYNAYVSSGRRTNADPKRAYSTLVPFELGTGDYNVLAPLARNDETMDQSAKPTSSVICLSCHRAHASGFESMLRFSVANEFMTISDQSGAAQYDGSSTEGKINRGKTVAEQQAAYYGRPASAFGPYARNLCNKCHAKD